jgi:hypothetical protein
MASMLPVASPRCTALIDHARDAMRRLVEVPAGADQAREAAEQIDLYWKHTPLTVAIAGALPLRTAVLNIVAGEPLFPAQRQEAGGMVLTISRGAVLTCRIRRRDGAVEELVLPERRATTEVREVDVLDVANSSAARTYAPAAVTATALAVVAPARRGWWRRVLAWVTGLFGRRSAPAAIAASPVPVAASAPAPAPPVSMPSATAAPSVARQRFIADLQAVLDASARGADVERLFLELDLGPLPRGVSAVEVPSSGGARWLGLADGCLLACAPGAELTDEDRALVQAARTRVPHVFAITPDGGDGPVGADPAVRYAGACATVLTRLPDILLLERALRLSAGAHAALRRTVPILDERITRIEAEARTRMSRLDALRVHDPAAFVAARIDRLRGRISEHTHALIRMATDQLLELLTRRESVWKASLSAATTADELRAAIARIDEQWPSTCAEVIEDVRSLVRSALGRAAADILQPFLAEIGGVAGASTRSIELPMSWGTSAPHGELVGGAPRLASLLQSTDTMKAAALERLGAGMAKARGRASADLLDAEPLLREALGSLFPSLETALREHLAGLAAQVAGEEANLARDSAALEELHKARAVTREDEVRLFDLVMLAEADLSLQLAS